MRHLSICLVISAAIGPATVGAQSAPTRSATEIAQIFTKYKHAVKERHGVRVQKFADIRSEPVVLQDLSDYAGEYRSTDHGFTLRLSVSDAGVVSGGGEEPGMGEPPRRFELKDAEISAGVLRATKVYDDGARSRIEGAFLQRTDRRAPTDEGTRMFGLGVPDQHVDLGGGMRADRLFYERRGT